MKRYGKKAALAGAWAGALLMVGACSKPEEQAPASPAAGPRAEPSAVEERAEAPQAAPGVEAPSAVEYVMPREPVTANAPPPPPPKDFQLGQLREDVVRLLGECSERMLFEPGGSGALSVEILQPKEGECRKRLGERNFLIAGGALKEIRPGVLPPPPPPKPRPRDL